MKHFILFVLGLIALFVLLGSVGPMILLGVGVWLLYLVFKQFIKADSLGKKIAWIVLGLFILSVTVANMFALIGLVAAYGLYLIYKEYKKEKVESWDDSSNNDPFMNFEKEWAELNR